MSLQLSFDSLLLSMNFQIQDFCRLLIWNSGMWLFQDPAYLKTFQWFQDWAEILNQGFRIHCNTIPIQVWLIDYLFLDYIFDVNRILYDRVIPGHYIFPSAKWIMTLTFQIDQHSAKFQLCRDGQTQWN